MNKWILKRRILQIKMVLSKVGGDWFTESTDFEEI